MNAYEEFNVVKAIEYPARNREITVHGDPNDIHFTVQEIIDLYKIQMLISLNGSNVFSVFSPVFEYEGNFLETTSRYFVSIAEIGMFLTEQYKDADNKLFVLGISCQRYICPTTFLEKKKYLVRFANA